MLHGSFREEGFRGVKNEGKEDLQINKLTNATKSKCSRSE